MEKDKLIKEMMLLDGLEDDNTPQILKDWEQKNLQEVKNEEQKDLKEMKNEVQKDLCFKNTFDKKEIIATTENEIKEYLIQID